MTTETRSLGRWQEPVLRDPDGFRDAHPETVVGPELMDRLERRISRLAASFESDPVERREVAAAIRLRIIEAATGTRGQDEAGRPIHDYLAQSDAYIVRHAAARVWNELRRERRMRRAQVAFADLAPRGADWAGEEAAADPPIAAPELAPDSAIAADEIADLVVERLSPAQRRVFGLLVGGMPRPEVGAALGLDRRTVADHVASIRRATLEVLAEREDRDLLADAARRSTYRRRPVAA